jgi:integrase
MTRVARGIYRDTRSFRVTWQDRGHQREKRFALDTPLDVLKKWRKRQVEQSAQWGPQPQTGLARDIVRFLKGRKTMPGYKAERSHLRAWLQFSPRISRWGLSPEHVRSAVAAWQSDGYSAQEIKHRVRALKQLYRTLDGHGTPTPADGIALPKIAHHRPVPVPDDLIRQVAIHLRAHEITKRLRTAKTRARYLVLATTGQRPAQVMRAKPGDVDLEQRIWWVRPAKGDQGTVVVLNDDMRAAWALFIQAKAWGAFDGRSFVKTLQRNGWPKDIRPYNLRHTVGLALSARGVDLGDVQAHMGHRDPRTTRTFYVPALLQRQAAASAAIEGRIGPLAMTPRHDSEAQPIPTTRKQAQRRVLTGRLKNMAADRKTEEIA